MAVPIYVSCQSGRKEFLRVVQGKQSILMIFPGKFFWVYCESSPAFKRQGNVRAPLAQRLLFWMVCSYLELEAISYTYLCIIPIQTPYKS